MDKSKEEHTYMLLDEIDPDGYLEIKFLGEDPETGGGRIKTYMFRETKGWRVESGWLRIFLHTLNISFPYHRIEYVKCIYNSDAVQAQYAERAREKGPTDIFNCLKCGGEIK